MKQKLEKQKNSAQSRRLRIVLCSFDSKYSHTNLALRLLREASLAYLPAEAELILAEYTINEQPQLLLRKLFELKADIYAFSCYIWNSQLTRRIVSELRKLKPECKIILGGPEVSWQSVEIMTDLPAVDFVLSGEGEISLPPLLLGLIQGREADELCQEINGITWRSRTDRICSRPVEKLMLDAEWPYAYSDQELHDLSERILYYESSRGCPFGCTYCMSSRDRRVRYRNLDKVYTELDKFIAADVKLVKFVDRTFNCDPTRAYKIWRYLIDRSVETGCRTRFHFEIAADLLDESALELLRQVPEGLFQFEIGVQTCSPNVLRLINRKCNLDHLFDNCRQLREHGLIHIHLDLIAGLPSDNLSQFISSFNKVMTMNPNMLQLGFLKVLPGSIMREQAEERGMIYSDYPPYEILLSDAMSYSDLLLLKRVEVQLDQYYNSSSFTLTISQLMLYAESAFFLFSALAEIYRLQGWEEKAPGRQAVWELPLKLLASETAKICCPVHKPDINLIRDCLIIDYICSGQKDQPVWQDALELSNTAIDRNLVRQMRARNRQEYPGMKRVRIEKFSYDPLMLLRYRQELLKTGCQKTLDLSNDLDDKIFRAGATKNTNYWLAVFDMSKRLPQIIWRIDSNSDIRTGSIEKI